MSKTKVIEKEVTSEKPVEEKAKAKVRNNIAVQGNNPLSR